MSISQGGTAGGPQKGPDAWRYFEHQHINWNYQIPPSQTNDSGPGNLIGQNFDIAGGLERGEFAELVAVITNTQLDIRPDDDAADIEASPLVVRCDWEWQRDISANFTQAATNKTVNSNDPSTELRVDFDASVSNTDFSLQYGTMSAAASFSDQTDGSGGAGSMQEQHVVTSYRDLMGRGPFFDFQDPIRLDASLGLNGGLKGASTIVLSGQTHFMWDLFEDPERDLDRLQDIRPVDR